MNESTEHGFTYATNDRATIRQWAEAAGGWPALVDGESGTDRVEIVFEEEAADESGRAAVSWEEFFAALEDEDLVLAFDPAGDEDDAVPRYEVLDRESAADDAAVDTEWREERRGGPRGRAAARRRAAIRRPRA
jgi:hypothetical protein